jgi:hypothetical protein
VSPLTLRGFLTITALAAVVCAIAISSYLALTGALTGESAAFTAIGSLFLGFMLAGCCYMVRLKRELQLLDLPRNRLQPNERMIRKSVGCMVHYKGGNPSRTWEGVGGKLFLTSQRLVFLAHRGQPWHYQLYLPLADILTVEPCDAGPGVPGGLAVLLAGGRREVFSWGALRFEDADEWTDDVMAACRKAKRE